MVKYLRTLIIFLVLVLIGIGVYYAYIKISPPKSTSLIVVTETPRPVQTDTSKNKNDVISKYSDYTTQDSKNLGKEITIQGVFQAVDRPEKVINDIKYNYVIGIETSDGALASVWLTDIEYAQINNVVSKYGRQGVPVTIILAGDIVNITTPYESTKN